MKTIVDRLATALNTLETESKEWRPEDQEGKPGGIILLQQDIPTLVVPDLHGRSSYLPDLMQFKKAGKTVFDLLKTGRIQIVCVGDGMHSERRGKDRWQTAYSEYKEKFEPCPAMTEEMTENFQTMSMVMKLKSTFPGHFHFLKGNHENILDEEGNGNHPFRKFAAEGPMTTYYVKKFYGESFLHDYDRFEKQLPLLARGKFFIITHAQPKNTYSIDDILNYRNRPDVTEGLTWTRQQNADPEAILGMLDELIGNSHPQRFWFSGHTSLKTRYRQSAELSLFEIHNPDMRSLVILDPLLPFDSEEHIIDLPSTETVA
jgi:calcineurin-like phosphoesterase family protein